MAIGWMTVLKLVPWGDVIENAPKVAQGAKKLWQTVGKKPPVAAPQADDASSQLTEATVTVAQLQAQVAELQVATAALHQQMLESSALIKSLAEQNSTLVARVELSRKRLLGLTLLVAALAVATIYKLF